MMELVTGGSGSGKSAYAEEALCGPASFPDRGQGNETGTQQDGQRYYIATMPSWDKETEKKIAKHRAMRAGKGFCTLEWYTDFEERLERADCPGMEGADILVECLSNLTANEMYMEGGAGKNTADAVIRGILCLRDRCRNLVVVTNDVFSESAEDSPEMRIYKETLGRINCALAEAADRVTEVVCGIPCTVKPETGRETEEEKEGDGGMRIITGGAFQGKRAFAEKLYPGVEWTDGGRCALDEIRTCRAVYGFHEFVKRWLEQGKSWEELASLMLEENRDLILICDEIGCGLVPVDAFEREYRESTGRVMNALAEQAERVDRVVCGIGRRIK
ncbi:bifunctional adenosylcobinamide kinase/adenosylcobinamide-phosphate guanylyltransferase [Lachnoclostridium sp. An76]|uniref:bifunctional adenosylcobinamide kinase/adenosylcobinamide-phosphate guanylyltransferase n=1 Tax=Lachnoclostridium sp. An76 TaxID=1965654 RepID=UPI000B3A4D03|nr:bifunctional adenosylcobinamide kinase/adenosylcobinamide-phosphate guanylyltransferase [Lachnoclostridium sp. An76]OUN32990.1 hypothetical protein B5G27_14275 [Lachnoclostridium sp. An76]